MARAYRKVSRRPLNDVPADGKPVTLVELGSHCRGAVFLDGTRFRSPALEDAIDRAAKAHLGFLFGRFDIRVVGRGFPRRRFSTNTGVEWRIG